MMPAGYFGTSGSAVALLLVKLTVTSTRSGLQCVRSSPMLVSLCQISSVQSLLNIDLQTNVVRRKQLDKFHLICGIWGLAVTLRSYTCNSEISGKAHKTTMAEAFVGLLISKLGMALGKEAATYGASQISKEASDLRGLVDEIHKAKEELESIKAYLHDTEKFKDTNETTSIFARRIQDLAFQIEDVVDEFTYKLEDDKHIGFASKTKKRIRHINIWGRLALELRRIDVELEDATKRRDRYTMLRIGKDNGSDHHVRSNNQIVCLARKEDLVGIEDSVDELKRWLVSDFDAGVGKTTLVDHVYNIVKKDFDAAAWVTVSKNYQVEDLLKKIAREFGISVDANNMELRSLVADIRKYLEGKRYILVLDDVWEKDVWINIMDVFPINCISRFVLTSRKHEVASLATSNCAIQLEPLGENDSWKLFCNVAFRNDVDKRCPSELNDLATKFLQKCEGLPLDIACIGRLLSCKPPTYSAWKNLYDELELQSTTNVIQGVNIILKVSFEDLPYELKNCFLHCVIFPEDYHIKRRRLIRHWITAGFIKKQEKTALEQVAEGYLNELVSRSLLQVAKTNEFGRVKCCRMHDVIRCLALEKAERESFAKVYGGSGRFWIGTARRLSIQSTNIATLSESGAMRPCNPCLHELCRY
jgi:disease resistance protein RPM1